MKPGEFKARIGTVEFTDRAEFEAAAKIWRKTVKPVRRSEHGRTAFIGGIYPDAELTGTNHGLVSRARGKWRRPTSKPFDLSKWDGVEVCDRCGLVADISASTNGQVRWWMEHVSMCVGVQAVAS